MATIAQLTDLHLLEDDFERRPLGPRARLSFLSFGRPLNAQERRQRVATALAEARDANADHLLITGDLTEDGHFAQFEVLAELLHDSRISPSRITLVPGNHDAYCEGGAFADAMAGPLKAFAATSQCGTPIALRDVTLVPVSTAFHQSVLRSAGAIAKDELEGLARVVADPAFAGRPLVFAQHHPPSRHGLPFWHWIDGLIEHATLTEMFDRCPHLYVVHGHTHRAVNRSVRQGEAARIFSAKAVVECESTLRLYEASPDGLSPLTLDLADGLGAFALPA
jgi:3',5'-cyclic AMP phosphodiesterase CpdA